MTSTTSSSSSIISSFPYLSLLYCLVSVVIILSSLAQPVFSQGYDSINTLNTNTTCVQIQRTATQPIDRGNLGICSIYTGSTIDYNNGNIVSVPFVSYENAIVRTIDINTGRKIDPANYGVYESQQALLWYNYFLNVMQTWNCDWRSYLYGHYKCNDCKFAYARWVCAMWFPQCSAPSVDPLKKNPILPCMWVCEQVMRACPTGLGFICPPSGDYRDYAISPFCNYLDWDPSKKGGSEKTIMSLVLCLTSLLLLIT